MAEIAVAGFFICGVWGFVDICRRIKRKITGDSPRKGMRLSKEEVAAVMIARAEKGDKEAVTWLEEHGYERR